ncbi:cytochrome P450 [Hypoxylon trugodes]|uniref:cytochrome P450 n=1 Tax=Hypoxylon trugodes TaxID=326681 RepID=UPI00219F4017|nr:cytochrome P450 [Hypoxylon trugodes]KAI1387289.1 cytochrome P450 [Hypoxylon trugodes]
MDVITNVLADRSPVLASVAIILVTVFIASRLFDRESLSHLPLVGAEFGDAEKRRKAYITNSLDFYKKGYELYKSKPFRITSLDGDVIVLPRHLMEEVRQLPDECIDIHKAFDVMNEQKHLGMGDTRRTKFLVHIVQHDLTRGLVRVNPRLSAETNRAVHSELPPCDDWTPAVVYSTLLRIVAIVSGALFIGEELCRSEEYIQASIGYTLDFIGAVENLKKWHRRWRWFGRYFTPEVDKLFSDRKKAHNFLRPIIEQRRAAMKAGREMPDDALQWMLNSVDKFGLTDADLAETQLGMSLAAIHTTTLTLTLIIYDLVIRPDVVNELREEIRTVTAAHNGVMTTQALFEMKLLDSVMKESQRVNPGSTVRFQRFVAKPVTLSDGTYLPAGYMIETAHGLTVSDPELFPNPEEFDAHRFQNLRNGTAEDKLNYKNKEQYQFVTMTKDFMSFGYGRHSCPGRYFAAQEIKLIIARLLLDFDMKMPDGLTERYANLSQGANAFPDPTKEVLFRRVKNT